MTAELGELGVGVYPWGFTDLEVIRRVVLEATGGCVCKGVPWKLSTGVMLIPAGHHVGRGVGGCLGVSRFLCSSLGGSRETVVQYSSLQRIHSWLTGSTKTDIAYYDPAEIQFLGVGASLWPLRWLRTLCTRMMSLPSNK